MKVQMPGQTNDDFPTITVGTSAGIAVALTIGVAVVIIIIRKRRYQPDKRTLEMTQTTKLSDRDADKAENDDRLGTGTNEIEIKDERTYYNTLLSNSKLKTEDLYRYLSKSDETYQQEFLLLPGGLTRPCKEAKEPKNAKKNRYNMVYPYDDSRVKVRDEHPDYINASYIDGYKKEKAYIACLGPTERTHGDFSVFWKMIWQEKVEIIVMLTNLKEGTRMKCEQYWPNAGKSMKYGNVTVNCTNAEEYAEFVVRNMTISREKEERQFHHVHFTAWPDKGVPSDVISIINLRNKVLNMRRKFDGPLVVHCSAGIGRTGTYIALDILIYQGLAEQSVDVLGCVMKMREQRVNMVQTVEQYKYLHHALLWSMSLDTTPIHTDLLFDVSWIYQDDGLAKMMKQLQMENWYDSVEEKNAVEHHKLIPFANRQDADIPGSRHAVRVMKCDSNCQIRADYINAVFIDGYKRRDRFIAAQTPLPETVAQFLDMILQQQVTCIIDLEPSDRSLEDVGEYLPEKSQELQNGNAVFRAVLRTDFDTYVKHDLEVVEDRQNSRSIAHYQFTKWPKSALVPDSVKFVQFIHEVEKHLIQTETHGPILVHCINGAERSALFCAMWLLIERIGIDNSVSVLNTLRQVKSRRRKAIPNKEQIEFCFKGIATHLNQLNTNVYSNMKI